MSDIYKENKCLVYNSQADAEAGLAIQNAPCNPCTQKLSNNDESCIWESEVSQRPDGKWWHRKHPVAERMNGITGVITHTIEDYDPDIFENRSDT